MWIRSKGSEFLSTFSDLKPLRREKRNELVSALETVGRHKIPRVCFRDLGRRETCGDRLAGVTSRVVCLGAVFVESETRHDYFHGLPRNWVARRRSTKILGDIPDQLFQFGLGVGGEPTSGSVVERSGERLTFLEP